MKAIILAGGAGTRLAPISSDIPKPMAPLPGAPVMEYLLGLLRAHGIRDITAAVHHLPEQIEDYFRDGSSFGVDMKYSREEEPLGTAGAVRRCTGGDERETVIVMSGDAVCDFDLTECLRFHNSKRAEATLVLHRHRSPMEYGLVLCDDDGRVRRFVEKPSWPQVFGCAVNTGIYILEPSALERVPADKPFDFARDLFPLLLSEGAAMYGCVPGGYWTDIGSCESYLEACHDLLEGRVDLPVPPSAPAPEGVTVLGPCYIGPGARIGKGTVLGPLTCVEPGSVIGENCRISRSMICAASVAGESRLDGAVLCSGARTGRGCEMREGSVLGAGAVLGEGCIISENVRVWPNRFVAGGTVLRANLVNGNIRTNTFFTDSGAIRAEAGPQINVEYCARLGGAAALGARMGIGFHGGNLAQSLVHSLCAGARSTGCCVYMHDAENRAQAAFAASVYDFPISVFLEECGSDISIDFRGPGGGPLPRQSERQIESVLRRGEWKQVQPADTGALREISGLRAAHISAALASAPGKYGALRAAEGLPGSYLLSELIERAGPPPADEHTSCVNLTGGGRFIELSLPGGKTVSREAMLLLTGYLLLRGGARVLAAPSGTPFALESLASSAGAHLSWEGDDDYPSALRQCRAMEDGLFAAALLMRELSKTGAEELLTRLPAFYAKSAEVPLSKERGDIMSSFCGALGSRAQLGRGITCRDRRGYVRITPSSSRAAIHVAAEAASVELAEELCGDFVNMARKFDGGGS